MSLRRLVRGIGIALLFLVIALCLATVIVPRFLDRIYYRGPASGHFDGEHFFNADGSDDDTRGVPGGGNRAAFFWNQLTGRDGRPAWPGSVPVRPARPSELSPRSTAGQRVAATPAEIAATPMRVMWIGHASVLVQVAGLNILTDPVWSDTAGPFGFGPKRVAAPGIAFDDLPRIDLVLVSHNHYDHLDLATLRRLWARDRPLIVTSLGNDAVLRQAGVPAVARDWGQAVTVEGRAPVGPRTFWPGTVKVIVNRSHHWGSRWFADRNRALWSSFVVTLPGGNLFFAGDTGAGDLGWADDAARAGPIRLALIPIGAFRFVPGQMASAAHIGPVDAVEVFRRLGARTAIPIHWGTVRLSYEGYRTPPALLRAALACSRLPEVDPSRRFRPVRIGRPVTIAPLSTMPPPVLELGIVPRAEILRCLDTPAVRALR